MKLLKPLIPSKKNNFIVFLFLSQIVFAQTKMWQSIENEPTTFGLKQINPQKYKVLKLDVTSIKSFLSKTPLEFTAAAKSVSSVLELPMPDGSFEEFVVVESPMMEAELAQKFLLESEMIYTTYFRYFIFNL